MKVVLRIRSDLANLIRTDLRRRHPFARERVGFVSANAAQVSEGLLLLAYAYHPVEDEDYLDDPKVRAMLGSSAFRKALQIAYINKVSMIHVHLHEHRGIPAFSRIDLVESAKFVPDFFHVAAHFPHCAVILSANAASGLCWQPGQTRPSYFDEIAEVGVPMRVSKRVDHATKTFR
jgi:hypothetical protein